MVKSITSEPWESKHEAVRDLHESPNTPFLKRLKLGNFKSIRNCDLELAPLTILVGRNSSGKSTLIQSILLLAQNASSPDPRGLGAKGILDINGSLITLGQFSELINDNASESDQYISIGCNFQFPIPPRGRWLESILNVDDEFRNIDIDLWSSSQNVAPALRGCNLVLHTEFEANDNEYEKNLLRVRSGSASISVNGNEIQEIVGSKNNIQQNSLEAKFDDKYDHNFSSSVRTKANLKNRKAVHTDPRNYLVYPNKLKNRHLEATQFMLGTPITGLESMKTLEIVIKHQNQFFSRPQTIASEIVRSLRGEASRSHELNKEPISKDDIDRLSQISIDTYAKKCIEVARDISDLDWGSEELYAIGQELLPWSSLDIPVKKYLDDYPGVHSYFEEDPRLSEEEMAMAEAEHDIYLLSEINNYVKPYQMNTVELANLKKSISSSLTVFWRRVKSRVDEIKESEESLPTRLVPTGFALVDDLADFDEENSLNLTVGYAVKKFTEYLQRVSYLGPLRKAPTEIYERFSTPGSSQTPLGLEGERLGQLVFENPVSYYPIPIATSGLDLVSIDVKMCNFREALNAWLLKLGIAREGVASIPESHYGLKLTVDGRPLRSLGVGVSQVIPVIATCLVAGRGSMVLLEEPELHLNPSLQRQLADFFVAMTLPGADRQLVVETHSEYLITRLRVHAVKSKEQAKLIKLLFASQTTTLDSSFSTYQELTPDENGEIPEWPELPGHEDGYFGQVPHDIQQLLQILIERHKNSGMPE